jgi:hypothetical protein
MITLQRLGAACVRRMAFVPTATLVCLITTLVILAPSAPAFAQVAAANFYRPEIAAKFPPGRASKCPGGVCDGEARRLNTAWKNLTDFDAAHPDMRDLFTAQQDLEKAKKNVADVQPAPKGAPKAARDAAASANTTADANLARARNKESDAKKKLDGANGGNGYQLQNQLADLLDAVDHYAADLDTCERQCPAAAERAAPPEQPQPAGPAAPALPPTSGAGVGTYVDPEHREQSGAKNGISAHDFYLLLDRSLGVRFHSLVLVFGGCFTADFTNQGAVSGVGKSGKPVAILSATDRCKSGEMATGDSNGAFFVQGVLTGFTTGGGTANDAFKGGQIGVTRGVGNHPGDPSFPPSTPSSVFLPQGTGVGEAIKLGPASGATSFHAILFFGRPTKCGDWTDIYQTWRMLKGAGYPEKNIKVFFGNGKRSTKDGTPMVEPSSITTTSVRQLASDPRNGCKYDGESTADGTFMPYDAATFDNVQGAIENWKQEAQKSTTEQYFALAHGHNSRTPDWLQSATPQPGSSPPPPGVPPNDEHGMAPIQPGGPGFPFGFGGGSFGFGFGGGSDDGQRDRGFGNDPNRRR